MAIATHGEIGNETAWEAEFTGSSSAAPPKPILRARIRKQFTRARDCGLRVEAEFQIPPGVMILFGPSGAGKSTLLRCISGIYRPDEGRVSVGDRVFYDSQLSINMEPAKRHIAFVFQELALFPHLTVEENTAYGLRRLHRDERETRTRRILESFQVAQLRRRMPTEISGGERQRVALARSLVTEPCALLLDEPLNSLDAAVKAGILDDLRAWNAERGIPILYVTHDREEALALGQRMMLLEHGRVSAEGAPMQVLDSPRRESVARLSGFENILDVEIVAVHETNGTMTCRPLTHRAENPTGEETPENITLEIPFTRMSHDGPVHIAIRAGDIMLATVRPEKLSARNILAGHIAEVGRTGARVTVAVNCSGVTFLAHVTAGAAESLELRSGCAVWLIIKSYSCHLLAPSPAPNKIPSCKLDAGRKKEQLR
jgi:molybdate transport system ATP-binding protein